MQRDYCRRYRADFIGYQTNTKSVDSMGDPQGPGDALSRRVQLFPKFISILGRSSSGVSKEKQRERYAC